MPPKRKPVKRKSLKNPVVRGTKQKQSQSQKVVVNVNTIKSKPRKKSGRGGLPPPSYQHNLAPTFVTQQATDYNPVIGAIASLTSRLQQEPRIQQPVTPLSSATQMANQQAQSMAGVKAEERREGSTAGNFQPLPSQADERLAQETQDKFDVEDKQAFEQKVSSGGGQVSVSSGGGQKTLGGGQHPSLGKLAPKSEESKERDAQLDAMMDKRADASKKQVDIYKVIKDKIDEGIELSAEELKKAQSPTGKTNLGKKRNKKIRGMEVANKIKYLGNIYVSTFTKGRTKSRWGT